MKLGSQKGKQIILHCLFVILLIKFGIQKIDCQISTSKLTPRQIAQQTLPSVVMLAMGNKNSDVIKTGSGFFVAEDVVATNYHVIKETTEGYVKIVGQQTIYEVLGIVGIDEKNDLALLKIKGIKGKPLKLNSDDSAAIGDEVYAVGNPEGLEGTFSQGIVSGIRKTATRNLLQITAPISEGSSGGAILNDKGEVVGVAVGAIESGQSLNFAIPVSLLRLLVSNQKALTALTSNNSASNKTLPNSNKTTQKTNTIPTNPIPKRNAKFQFKAPDLTEENFFGKVKLVKELCYFPEEKFGDWILGSASSTTLTRYNLDGYKEFSEKIFHSDKDIIDVVALDYFYNAKKEDLPFTIKTQYSYDYSANSVTEEEYSKCGKCSNFKFNRKFLIKYKKDENTKFQSNGEMLQKTIIERIDNGRIIKSIYNGDGTLLKKEVTFLDKEGEIKEIWQPIKGSYDQLELLFKTLTTEDKGQLKEIEICTNEMDLFCGGTTIRDKATKLVLQINDEPSARKYDYEFDAKGNWTKQTEHIEVTKFGKTFLEPYKVVIREITYY